MNASQLSSSALAYLGDSVIEICVREFLVSCGFSHSAELNRHALDFVKAKAQSEAVKKILPLLSEDENAVFRRGRNIGHTATPKSATPSQYRAATGMEALFGYLFLEGKHERIDFLFHEAYSEQISLLKERIIQKNGNKNQI